MDKFINDGTTTEYMTRHVGTYIDNAYAKIESTQTREYYRVDFSPPPGGSEAALELEPEASRLVASSTSYEVNGRQTTQHTVHHFRTKVDGHYAHVVTSESKVFSDPPIISATPVYHPYGQRPPSRKDDEYKFPREQISPSRPSEDENIVTRTIGAKDYSVRPPKLKLEHLLSLDDEKQSHPADNPNAIRARSIPQPPPTPDRKEEEVVTLTVSEDGELNIPTPSIEAIEAENEIEPTSVPHR